MTDDERGFADGLRSRITSDENGERSLPYWQAHRRGAGVLAALQDASQEHYIYGESGEAAYFYGDGAA